MDWGRGDWWTAVAIVILQWVGVSMTFLFFNLAVLWFIRG